MHVSEAPVSTGRASRYLVQLATHLDHLHDVPHDHPGQVPERPTVTSVEWNNTDATITFEWARCTMHASADTLTLRLEAATAAQLGTLQLLIGHRLEAISRREHLGVGWQPAVTCPSSGSGLHLGVPSNE
jgi:hypothetical protein